MNVLFLTLLDFESLDDSNLYTDLLREFTRQGHSVYVITPLERRQQKKTYIVSGSNSEVLHLKTPNTQKTGIFEKGISMISIPFLYKKGVQRYFANIKFDLILYSTPPITLTSVVKYFKRRDKARTYLLLKDIFPQNAVDIGLMSKKGIQGLLYNCFRRQERELYKISDHIGCMSEANVRYLLSHNPEVSKEKVAVCPNSIQVVDKSIDDRTRNIIRSKYGIPLDKAVFVYGGNLCKPQGIPFLIECLKAEKDNQNVFFLIVGNGTEYSDLSDYVSASKHNNAKLMRRLPKEDYDPLVAACDVGMIFLDHRFTIPNFPSRLLGYMQAKLPVLAVTDSNTDIGTVITAGGFGWWCESDDVEKFKKLVEGIMSEQPDKMGENAFSFLSDHYDVRESYKIIMDSLGIS